MIAIRVWMEPATALGADSGGIHIAPAVVALRLAIGAVWAWVVVRGIARKVEAR